MYNNCESACRWSVYQLTTLHNSDIQGTDNTDGEALKTAKAETNDKDNPILYDNPTFLTMPSRSQATHPAPVTNNPTPSNERRETTHGDGHFHGRDTWVNTPIID